MYSQVGENVVFVNIIVVMVFLDIILAVILNFFPSLEKILDYLNIPQGTQAMSQTDTKTWTLQLIDSSRQEAGRVKGAALASLKVLGETENKNFSVV